MFPFEEARESTRSSTASAGLGSPRVALASLGLAQPFQLAEISSRFVSSLESSSVPSASASPMTSSRNCSKSRPQASSVAIKSAEGGALRLPFSGFLRSYSLTRTNCAASCSCRPINSTRLEPPSPPASASRREGRDQTLDLRLVGHGLEAGGAVGASSRSACGSTAMASTISPSPTGAGAVSAGSLS